MAARRASPIRTAARLVASAALVAACGTPGPTAPPATAIAAASPAGGSPSAGGPQASAATPNPAGGPSASAPVPVGPLPALSPADAAQAVLTAADDASRRRAVLVLLHGVNLGVYAADGTQLIAGAERSYDDPWVYDFEADALALAVRDGDPVDLRDVAAGLSEIAAGNGGSLTQADVLAMIAADARSAAKDPAQPRAYAIAAAAALAKGDPFGVDLTQVDTSADTTTDALAAFLAAFDLVSPSIESLAPQATTARLAGWTDSTASGGCPPLQQGPPRTWVAGLSARGFLSTGPVTSNLNASFSRYLQGLLAGGLIDARLEGPPRWHHNHATANNQVTPGGLQKYAFTVTLRAPAPTTPVSCGPLAGWAASGAVVGDVTWQHPDLARHSVILTEEATTDLKGVSRLEVDPRIEQYPAGIGPEHSKLITITASMNVFRALGGDLYTRLAGVPAIQRRTVDTEVTWHDNYKVEVEINSPLTITRGVTYNGKLGTASARGTIEVTHLIAAGTAVRELPADNYGELTTRVIPPSTKGKCNTEWILPAPGKPRTIDWNLMDVVIWPPQQVSMRLENGFATELPDQYDGLICVPGVPPTHLGPTTGSVWESFLYLGHPGGIVLGPGGGRGGHWVVTSDPAEWQNGGVVGVWRSSETCGGRCTGTLTVSIRVTPIRP